MITSEDAIKIRNRVIQLRKHTRNLHKEASTDRVHQIEDRIYDLIKEMTEIKAAIEKADK